MRILIVKTSSLGDVIHNLPVVSDIRRHFPGAQVDWCVEQSFSPIPRLHPAVGKIIPVAVIDALALVEESGLVFKSSKLLQPTIKFPFRQTTAKNDAKY